MMDGPDVYDILMIAAFIGAVVLIALWRGGII